MEPRQKKKKKTHNARHAAALSFNFTHHIFNTFISVSATAGKGEKMNQPSPEFKGPAYQKNSFVIKIQYAFILEGVFFLACPIPSSLKLS